jgi:hypothetical protein
MPACDYDPLKTEQAQHYEYSSLKFTASQWVTTPTHL